MKDDKICFSKTLTYLVLLVAAVAGAFYTMNYVNQKKVTTDSEAASSFYTASKDCQSEVKSTNEAAYCVPAVITGNFNVVAYVKKFVTGSTFKSVRTTVKKCGKLGVVYFGRCVVLTKSTTTGTVGTSIRDTVAPTNTTILAPTLSSSRQRFGERAIAKCQKQNDVYFTNNGTRYSVDTVTEGGDDQNPNKTVQKCFKVNSKPIYSANCKIDSCISCVSEVVADSLCGNGGAYLPTTTCPSTDAKAKIKSIVSSITTTNSTRFSLSPNYYGWSSTNGSCLLINGDLVKQQTIGGNVNYGGQCKNKVVSDDYCTCATWKSEYPSVECSNVKSWINQSVYDNL